MNEKKKKKIVQVDIWCCEIKLKQQLFDDQ